jgi:predicted nucleic acid-binding protein
MPPAKPRIYMDSCCFIDIARHELVPATVKDERLKDIWFYRQMLKATIEGNLLLYTSQLTSNECLHLDGDASAEVQQCFERVLDARNGVVPVASTHFVTEEAKHLRWKHGLNLNPMDSIHVASAIRIKAKEFITTDGEGRSTGGSIFADKDALLKEFGLRVCLARDSVELPGDYKQEQMKL